MRVSGVFALTILPGLCFACLWDRDTLGQELRGLPEIRDIIAGRIERNPPLYFEMRADRVRKQLASGRGTSEERMALYDDLAVAYDRLGQHDEALAVMARKELEFATIRGSLSPAVRDDIRYKTLANRGTFFAHRGVKTKNPADREAALADLRACVALNPNAHFGRERVQIQLIEWLGKPSHEAESVLKSLSGSEQTEFYKGLVGIMTLGEAWNSPDLLLMVGLTMPHPVGNRHNYVARALALRFQELLAGQQQTPIYGFSSRHRIASGGHLDPQSRISNDAYAKLKANGEAFRRYREEYMLARLKAGRHPDTDPTFWDEYRPPPLPSDLEGSWLDRVQMLSNASPAPFLMFFGVTTLVGLAVWKVSQMVARR